MIPGPPELAVIALVIILLFVGRYAYVKIKEGKHAFERTRR